MHIRETTPKEAKDFFFSCWAAFFGDYLNYLKFLDHGQTCMGSLFHHLAAQNTAPAPAAILVTTAKSHEPHDCIILPVLSVQKNTSILLWDLHASVMLAHGSVSREFLTGAVRKSQSLSMTSDNLVTLVNQNLGIHFHPLFMQSIFSSGKSLVQRTEAAPLGDSSNHGTKGFSTGVAQLFPTTKQDQGLNKTIAQ